jgi:mono/diheme cytochrome c family protein
MVTDDPPGRIYWKVENGIRLTGMPGFKDMLTPTQMWQVSQMLQHADKLPDQTKAALAKPAALPVAPPSPTPAAMQGKKPEKIGGKK